MGGKVRFRAAVVWFLIACAVVTFAQENEARKLDREYQSAVANYDAGRHAEAASQLENLLPRMPKSFELHELLGLAYASLSQDTKAISHLETAAQLKPDSAQARTNLAATLMRAGKAEGAGEQFRKALELEPQDFDANHNLAEFYIQSGKIGEARTLPRTRTADSTLIVRERLRPDVELPSYWKACRGKAACAKSLARAKHRGDAQPAGPD